MQDPQRLPANGTTVHLCMVSEVVADVHIICAPAIIVKVEDGSELGPEEAPRDRMVTLAVVTPQGNLRIGGISYAPLAAHDFGGTWHFKDEHDALTASDTLTASDDLPVG